MYIETQRPPHIDTCTLRVRDVLWPESVFIWAFGGPQYWIHAHLDLLGVPSTCKMPGKLMRRSSRTSSRRWRQRFSDRKLHVFPRGSKYPILEVSGSKNHTLNGVWGLKPQTWGNVET